MFLPSYNGNADAVFAVGELVRGGLAELRDVIFDGENIGSFVYAKDWPELRLITGASVRAGALEDVLGHVEIEARRLGAVGVAIDTFRKGLIKILVERSGYSVCHVSLWKAV